MRGKSFTVPVAGGQVSGWVDGAGVPVLLLHGGPGLSYEYLDDLAADLGDGYEIAAYQQRGIAPSMLEGPYDVDTHLDDVAAVLDALGWQMAYVVGHSWGGHLAFHVALAMPERLLGVLTLDPLGAVGDGGEAIFGAELGARLPADVRKRAEELDQRAMAGEGSEEESLESLRLYWPAYYANVELAPPMPPISVSGRGLRRMLRVAAAATPGARGVASQHLGPGGDCRGRGESDAGRGVGRGDRGADPWRVGREGAQRRPLPVVREPGLRAVGAGSVGGGLMPTLAAVVSALERRYDPAWAEDWDSVGLVCGDPAATVTHIHFAVDPVGPVIDEAIAAGAQLLVTHHPLFLGGTESVAATTAKGRVVHRLITAGVGLYVAHTNADVARPGVSDALAAVLGLNDVRSLNADSERGLGRIGTLPAPITLREFAAAVAKALPATRWGVRAAGDPDRVVASVAVCGGSGGELAETAAVLGADVLVTSDLKHHRTSEALDDVGIALVDAGHWATEQPWVASAAEILAADLSALGTTVECTVSTTVTDPWTLHVNSPEEL